MRLQHVSKLQKKPSDFIISDIKIVTLLDRAYNTAYLRCGTDEEGRVVFRIGSANAGDDVLDMFIDHNAIPFILDWLTAQLENN